MKTSSALVITGLLFTASAVSADPLTCNLADYRPTPGLTAAAANDALTIAWDGDAGQQVRLRLTVMSGVPTIAELAVRPPRGDWRVVAAGLTPDYRVVSGVRRVTEQQFQPLRGPESGDDARNDRQDQVGRVLGRAAQYRAARGYARSTRFRRPRASVVRRGCRGSPKKCDAQRRPSRRPVVK